MRIEGNRRFPASREKVWELFTDPEALKAATPGAEELTAIGEDRYRAVMTVGVAGIRGTFEGTIELKDKQFPESYTMVIQGSGGPGFVNVEGDLKFEADGDETIVHYDWTVQVGGTIAGVGQRVLGGVGRWLIGEFFKKMEEQLAAG